jgi:hypothetical protein
MLSNSSETISTLPNDILNRLQRRVTCIKFKATGRTYARIYYLTLAEDAIHYQGSKHRAKHQACI